MQQFVLNEELALNRVPRPMHLIIGLGMAGPTIIVHGSDEQAQRFLPAIARDEMVWCQGFSEPGAGSDLASLQTRAVQDGDDFVINGQKIWTSYAHRADWCILLARTDPDAPKHRGISYFLVDLHSPGITIRPLVSMPGSHTFNEVFFDNVRVPRTNLVGEINRGWYAATTTLDFERSGIRMVMPAVRMLDDILDFARAQGGRLPSPVRHRLAELKIEVETGRLLSYRVAWLQSSGLVPNYQASIAKLYGTELQQRLANAGLHLLNAAGQFRPGAPNHRLARRLESYYLHAVALTIAAGTSEVQRSIIAIRGLGMPRA
jgi:alkylation response protein AidB-like acyl-CoA dehydrogenase